VTYSLSSDMVRFLLVFLFMRSDVEVNGFSPTTWFVRW
jgi:hypothetical protein